MLLVDLHADAHGGCDPWPSVESSMHALYGVQHIGVWGCVYVLMCIYALYCSVSVCAPVHMGTQAAILSPQSPALMSGGPCSSYGLAAHTGSVVLETFLPL